MLGRDFTDTKAAAEYLTRGQIGIVNQDDLMWPDQTFYENLKYIGRLKGMNEIEIDS